MSKTKNIDWNSLDWSKRDIDLSREIGCSREYVRQKRVELVPRDRYQKPFDVVLEPTVAATMEKYRVGEWLARVWHKQEGMKPGKRGPKTFVLPSGFVPGESASYDAKRLGVTPATMTAAYRRAGIPVRGVGRLMRKYNHANA
jgi:hypothetical protein